MRARERTTAVAFAAIMAVLAAASIGLQVVRDRLPVECRDAARFLYVRSDSALNRLTLAFQMLAADIYWIRTIQHYGGDRLAKGGAAKYELLYPLLDITTTLDPRFTIAYRFGAIFLAEPPPGGPGRADLALALLGKGVRAEPRKWQYVLDVGFIYYWQLGDSASAARWFQRAAETTGAPNWLAPLAATMLVQGGDRASSRFLWQQIRDSADQDWLRALAERRLVQLQALDQIDQLEALVGRFDRQAEPAPLTWERLVQAGALPGVPLDPAGTPYELNPWWGLVRVSERSPLYPMPVEPAAIQAHTR
jgi:hypothetical protein